MKLTENNKLTIHYSLLFVLFSMMFLGAVSITKQLDFTVIFGYAFLGFLLVIEYKKIVKLPEEIKPEYISIAKVVVFLVPLGLFLLNKEFPNALKYSITIIIIFILDMITRTVLGKFDKNIFKRFRKFFAVYGLLTIIFLSYDKIMMEFTGKITFGMALLVFIYLASYIGDMIFERLEINEEKNLELEKIKRLRTQEAKIEYNLKQLEKEKKDKKLFLSNIIKVSLTIAFNIIFLAIINIYVNSVSSNTKLQHVFSDFYMIGVLIFLLAIQNIEIKYLKIKNIDFVKKGLKITTNLIIIIIGLSVIKFLKSEQTSEMYFAITTLITLIVYKMFTKVNFTRMTLFKLGFLLVVIYAFINIDANFGWFYKNATVKAYNALGMIDILVFLMSLIICYIYIVIVYFKNVAEEKQFRMFSLIAIPSLIIILSSILGIINNNIFNSLYTSLNELTGIVVTLNKNPLIVFIIPSLLVALIFLNVNVSNRRNRIFIAIIKYVALLITLLIINDIVKTMIETKVYRNTTVLFSFLTSLAIAAGLNVKNVRFLVLVIEGIIQLLVVEFLLYIISVLGFKYVGLGVAHYRILFATYFGVLAFAYIYMRNIKIDRRNVIFSSYRVATIGVCAIALFFGFVANKGAGNLESDWIKNKLVDFLLNSDFAENIDPGRIQEILEDIDLENLPEDFDYDEIADSLPTYIEIEKSSDQPLFIKERNAVYYDSNIIGDNEQYSKEAGWNFTDDASTIFTDYNDTFDSLDGITLRNLENYFNTVGIDDWSYTEDVSAQIINKYKSTLNSLPLNTVVDNLVLESKDRLTKDENENVMFSEFGFDSYSYQSKTINYDNLEVVAEIMNLFENENYNSMQSLYYVYSNKTKIDAIRDQIIDNYKIDATFNDYEKLIIIGQYIKNNYETDLFNVWYAKNNLDEFIDTKEGDIGEAVTLYAFLARSMDIPLKVTKGYLVEGNSFEIKKEIPIPSFEINIPTIGFVDGSHLLLNIISSNDNDIPGNEGNDSNDKLFDLTRTTSNEFYLKNEVFQSVDFDEDGLLFNSHESAYDTSSNIWDEYSKVLSLFNFKDSYFKDEFGTIRKSQLFGNAVLPDLPLNAYGLSNEEIDSISVNNFDNYTMKPTEMLYAYAGRTLDWNNQELMEEYIRLFDNVDYSINSDSKTIVSNNIYQIMANDINNFTASLNTINSFEKIIAAKNYILSNFTLDNSSSNNFEDVVNYRLGNQDDFVVLMGILVESANVNMRITDVFHLIGEETTVYKSDVRKSLEIKVHNEDIWLEIPNYILDFQEMVPTVEIVPANENSEMESGTVVVNKNQITEEIVVNMCDYNDVNSMVYFMETMDLSTIQINRSNINSVDINYDYSIDNNYAVFHGSGYFERDCEYRFKSPGEYNFNYTVSSEISGLSRNFNLKVVVEMAKPEITIPDFSDQFITKTGENTIQVLRGYEFSICDVVAAKDKLLYNLTGNELLSQIDITQMVPDCLVTYNNVGNYIYSYRLESGLHDSIRRITMYDLNIEVIDDTPILTKTPENFEIYETQIANLRELIEAKYGNETQIDSQNIEIKVDNLLFNGSSYSFDQDPGNNNHVIANVEYTIKSITNGPDFKHSIQVKIKSAEPINFELLVHEFDIINNTSPKDGVKINNAIEQKYFSDMFQAINVITEENTDLRFEFNIFDENLNLIENTSDANKLLSYSVSQAEKFKKIRIQVILRETSTGRNRFYQTPMTDNIIANVYDDSLEIITSGQKELFENERIDLSTGVLIKDNLNLHNTSYYLECEVYDILDNLISTNCSYTASPLSGNNDEMFKIKYKTTSQGGDSYENVGNVLMVKVANPTLIVNSASINEIFKAYDYDLCGIATAYDAKGDNISSNIEISIDNELTYRDCSDFSNYAFNLTGTKTIYYRIKLNNRESKQSITINVVENVKPPVIELSTNTNNSTSMKLSNNSTTVKLSNPYTRTNQVLEKELIKFNVLELCSVFPNVKDSSTGNKLYPESIVNNALNLNITDCDADTTNNYKFSEKNYSNFIYTFRNEDAGASISIELKVNIVDKIFTLAETDTNSDFKEGELLKFYYVVLSETGDKSGYLVALSEKFNEDINYDEISPISSIISSAADDNYYIITDEKYQVGDIIESTVRYDGYLTNMTVDQYEGYFFTKIGLEKDNNVVEDDATELFLEQINAHSREKGNLFSINFTIEIEEDKVYYVDSRNIKLDLDTIDISAQIKQAINYDEDNLIELENKEFTIELLSTGSNYVFHKEVKISEITPEVVEEIVAKEVEKSDYKLFIIAGILVIGAVVLIIVLRKKPVKTEEEKQEELLNYQRKMQRVHFVKLIKKRYKNLLKTITYIYKKNGIRKSETHLEFAKNFMGKKPLEENGLLSAADIFCKCRYYEFMIKRIHFEFIEGYYQKEFDRLINMSEDISFKNKIISMKKY